MKSKLPLLALALAIVPGIFAADGPATGTNSTSSSAPIVSGGAEYAAVVRNSNGIYFREGGAQLPPYPLVARNESPSAREARMKWFHEARFGIFIHWGVYSVPARGEWYMNNAKVPVATYKAYAKDFKADKYDPQAWAQLFADAGAKYMVITAKHHDGFTMYDSKFSDWNVVKATPPPAICCNRSPMPSAPRASSSACIIRNRRTG